jgi:hypothetical protein
MPTLFKRLKYNDTGSIKPAAKLEVPSKRFFGSSKNVPRKAFGNCCIPPTILHRHNSKESTVHLCHTRTLSDNPIRLTRPA